MMHRTQQATVVCINCTVIVVFFADELFALPIKFRIKIVHKNVTLPSLYSIIFYGKCSESVQSCAEFTHCRQYRTGSCTEISAVTVRVSVL